MTRQQSGGSDFGSANQPEGNGVAQLDLPPHNGRAERGLLGCIMSDLTAMERVVSILHPEAFYNASNREIYMTMLMLHTQGGRTDLESVAQLLDQVGALERTGGREYLMETEREFRKGVTGTTYSSDISIEMAKLIDDDFFRRRLLRASKDILSLSTDTSKTVDQLMDEAEERLLEVKNGRPEPKYTVPIDLLKSCASRKGALFVYLILQVGAKNPAYGFPAIKEMASFCRMGIEGVREALKWLEQDGWVEKIEQPGYPSAFRIFYGRVNARKG